MLTPPDNSFDSIAIPPSDSFSLRDSDTLSSPLFMQRVLDLNPNIVYVYDIDEQRNVYSNGRIATILGYTQEEVVEMGASLFAKTIHPDDLDRVTQAQKKLCLANDDHVSEIEYRMLSASNGYRMLHSSDVVFARNSDGSVRQILGVAKDITAIRARHDAERDRLSAVIAVQQKLASATIDVDKLMDEIVRCVLTVTSADGAAIEQLDGEELVYSAAAGELGRFVGFRIHARGTISGECLRSGQTILSSGVESDTQPLGDSLRRLGIRSLIAVPLKHGDITSGILKATSTSDDAFDAAQAQTLELVAGFAAATLQRASEYTDKRALLNEQLQTLQRLHESEETFHLSIESMQEGVMILSPELEIQMSNAACEKIFGLSKEEYSNSALLRKVWRPIREEGWEMAQEDYPARVVFNTGEAVVDVIVGLERAEGQTTWLNTSAYPLTRDEHGNVLSVVFVISDITKHKIAEQTLSDQMQQIKDQRVVMSFQMHELEQANSRLGALALTDGLTGLNNHRSFQELLEIEVSRAERYTAALSLVILDVDHFKAYNDSFGHPAGDALLQMIAKELREAARQSDFVARYGGEEFVVILPETDREGAAVIAERFRKRIESIAGTRRPVSASFGVSVFRPGHTPSDLISNADQAMYHSKHSGRNCVTLA